jgi:hypothetical protein
MWLPLIPLSLPPNGAIHRMLVHRVVRVFMTILALCHLSAIGTETLAASSKTERAIWSTKAIVDSAARSAFLGEVTKFADKEMFAIRISEPRGDGVHFLVQMWREDVKIIILNPFDDPAQFSCAFYLTGTEPVPDEVIEALAKHLKGDLSLVPGVVFKDKN